MPRFLRLFRTFCPVVLFLTSVACAAGAPPRYDHVVVVIEENENFTSIIGNRVSAPYLNKLADGGVVFTRMRGVTHPSHPNYLELFSGSNQGVVSDSPPTSPLPFSTPNLAASLIGAGFGFIGYADGLPKAGDIVSDNLANGYTRRHCPWVWWVSNTQPTPTNRLPPSVHQPFTAFPSDFSQLPTVAFVIPSNRNNMHDYGVSSGDIWVEQNLSAYAEWAKTHNSLLIVTWDEDAFQVSNLIPTIFYGANLRNGVNAGSWTHHNLLRTLEEMYGLSHSGRAASAPSIIGAFSGEPQVATRVFSRDGSTGSYDGSFSYVVSQSQPNSTSNSMSVVKTTTASSQGLIRFDNLFGQGATQIPPTAEFASAKLVITTNVSTGANSTGTITLHKMLAPWTAPPSWNSTVGGVSTDDIEAAITPDFSAVPSYLGTTVTFDVTATLNSWRTGGNNYGWTLQATSTDGWDFCEATHARLPIALEISYIPTNTLRFTTNRVVARESDGSVTLTVTRQGDASEALTALCTTSTGTAVPPQDYQHSSSTLSWEAGDSSPRQISIPIVADTTTEGVEYFSVVLRNPTGLCWVDEASQPKVFLSDTPYDHWSLTVDPAFYETGGGASGDPDRDGVVNLMEYAFGSHPLQRSSETLPVVSVEGDFLTLSFLRDPSRTDLTYTVQASSDLQTWENGSTYSASASTPTTQVTTEISHIPGPIERITVRDNTPISSGNRRFLRLQVVRSN